MPTTTTPRKYVDAGFLEDRFGNDRSAFARWTKKLGFPACRYLGTKRVWILAEVEAWEATQLGTTPGRNVLNLTPRVSASAPIEPLQTR
jgi:predicted DNA-binding transcriptional regulator AlpA